MRNVWLTKVAGDIAFLLSGLALGLGLGTTQGQGAASPGIVFNKSFEGASLGTIETLGETQFRCHVEGQYDEHGHNRQASWYYFQMSRVQGRDITLTMTDFVGEYNGKPGACPMNSVIIPVFSYDNLSWEHFPSMTWDDQKKEATLRLTPQKDTIWVAHVPPYPHSRVLSLLQELKSRPSILEEVIGRTVQGRDLHLVTVTDFDKPDSKKKTVWLITRQHAWEAGTSFVMEGALRFISSDDDGARRLRQQLVFKFMPTMDPDGCAGGKVRFNANGYDLNRHWDEVDLRHKQLLEKMPEIWYGKKAILTYVDSGHLIDLMINLHNDEMPEYIGSQISDEPAKRRAEGLFKALTANTLFDPGKELSTGEPPDHTTNYLYQERRIPVLTMELRIGPSQKLGRQPTVQDRLTFGRQLVIATAEAVLAE
jgi:hypothetical protein